jgi:hypothetical protein
VSPIVLRKTILRIFIGRLFKLVTWFFMVEEGRRGGKGAKIPRTSGGGSGFAVMKLDFSRLWSG